MDEEINLRNNPELKASLEKLQKTMVNPNDIFGKYVYRLATSREGDLQYNLAKASLTILGVFSIQVIREKRVIVDMTTASTTTYIGFIKLMTAKSAITYGILDSVPLNVRKLYDIRLTEQPYDPKATLGVPPSYRGGKTPYDQKGNCE